MRKCQVDTCGQKALFHEGVQWSFCKLHLELANVGPGYRRGRAMIDLKDEYDMTDKTNNNNKNKKHKTANPNHIDDVPKGMLDPEDRGIPLRYIHRSVRDEGPKRKLTRIEILEGQERIALKRAQENIRESIRKAKSMELKKVINREKEDEV